jgi:hypothetical protein
MNLNSRLTNLPAFLAALLIPATTLFGSILVSPAHAQTESEPKCSLATIKGSYVIQLTGWIGSGANRLPYASTGTFVADGNGYLQGVDTVVLDGAAPVQRLVTATYTVDPNTCSGTATSPAAGSFNFFILENGKKIINISTTPGTTVTGFAEKQ